MKVVITLSKTFPKWHPRAGQATEFAENVMCDRKIHTLRDNYNYWAKKIAKLKEVGGILSIREWTGKPYNSPQRVIVDIPSESVGVQKYQVCEYTDAEDGQDRAIRVIDNMAKPFLTCHTIAYNDGLFEDDFRAWFAKSDFREPIAIIHFTNFRY